MKTRSTFRRRQSRVQPRFIISNSSWALHFAAVREIGRNAPKNLPGETNRQLAARLREPVRLHEPVMAEDAPAKPKRVRTKKAAA